jgi:CheY-like chemotaxis protein
LLAAERDLAMGMGWSRMPAVISFPGVLIVEDDVAIRNLLTAALEREPLRVDSASDGVAALEKVRTAPYAVLLVDLMMPRMNGFGFVEALRELELPSPPVVIVMTAFDDAAIRQLDSRLVHACLRKPFDIPLVVELVRDCAELMTGVRSAQATRDGFTMGEAPEN